jgi:hypothetical protein
MVRWSVGEEQQQMGRKKESFRLEKRLSQQQEVQDAELQIPHGRALPASWWQRGSAEM